MHEDRPGDWLATLVIYYCCHQCQCPMITFQFTFAQYWTFCMISSILVSLVISFILTVCRRTRKLQSPCCHCNTLIFVNVISKWYSFAFFKEFFKVFWVRPFWFSAPLSTMVDLRLNLSLIWRLLAHKHYSYREDGMKPSNW